MDCMTFVPWIDWQHFISEHSISEHGNSEHGECGSTIVLSHILAHDANLLPLPFRVGLASG